MHKSQIVRPKPDCQSEIHSERACKKFISLCVKIVEARININVATLGSMKLYCKINSDQIEWKTHSLSGSNPKWNATYEFRIKESSSLKVVVHHKEMIFGEKEVGSCDINVKEVSQGRFSNWWSLQNLKGDTIGSIMLKFEGEIDRRYTDSSMFGVVSTHSTNNSVDIKEEFSKKNDFNKLSNKSLRNDTKLKLPRSDQRRSETEEREREDSLEISDSRRKLDQETRIKIKEEKVKECLYRINKQAQNLVNEKNEIQILKQNLSKREDFLAQEKLRVSKERNYINEERKKLEAFKEQLNVNYAQLKQDKYKAQAHMKLLEATKNRLNKTSLQITKHRNKLNVLEMKRKESFNTLDSHKENLDLKMKKEDFETKQYQIQRNGNSKILGDLTIRLEPCCEPEIDNNVSRSVISLSECVRPIEHEEDSPLSFDGGSDEDVNLIDDNTIDQINSN
ncbi:unnamed protein product [Blepharisma stoltei]|uniref:C2 domain-containing protein n=1 Tax=Blepharisma stoltei TaxID=1481888 RepID=A0AAU9IZD8_9CILI|nr:unnamed protein product [Blepharisma stoltei]